MCFDGYCRSIYGPWLKCRQKDRTFRLALRGGYGFYYSEFLRGSEHGEFRFIDVGANLGLYSLLAGFNPLCTGVDSFEPNRETLEYLTCNLRRNNISGTLHPYAISSRTGIRTIWEPEGHSGAASLEDDDFVGRIGSEVTLVGAEYLRHSLGSTSENFVLKIDVEGHELKVLEAFRDADLLGRTRSIWLEVSAGTEPDCKALLEGAGFKAVHSEGSSMRWDVLFKQLAR